MSRGALSSRIFPGEAGGGEMLHHVLREGDRGSEWRGIAGPGGTWPWTRVRKETGPKCHPDPVPRGPL